MKIIISDDSNGTNAHSYIRLGLARALSACGHETFIWNINQKSAIDIFDEINPEIFLGQTYNLERGLIKALCERPHIKVVLTGSDWGDQSDQMDLNRFPILVANPTEIKLTELLNKERGIDRIVCHYHPSRIHITHHHWEDKLGIPIGGVPLAADISDYTGGRFHEEFKSDVCFVGGRWGYKGRTIDKWLVPLCDSRLSLNIKIFGNRGWGLVQYAGFIDTKYVRHIMKSAKVCPNMHEEHSQVYGIDVVERVFKILSNKCPCVSDYVESLAVDFFPNGEVEFAKTPQEYKEKCLAVINGDLIIDTEKAYQKVMAEETYFNRASSILSYIGLEEESRNILSIYNQIRKENSL